MTILGRREARFRDITRLRKLGTRHYAMTGVRRTVLSSTYADGLVTVVGETVDLGHEARDVASNGTTELYILTDSGIKIAAYADDPVVSGTHTFNPGDGKWIFYRASGQTIVAPINRGVQILDATTGQISRAMPGEMKSCAGAALSSDDVLYVVDQVRAKIHLFRVYDDVVRYVVSYPAPHCRDVIKVELDEAEDRLFVVCRHRIVAFSVPNTGLEDDALTVSVLQDYGVIRPEYTDFAVTPEGYWVGIDYDSAMNLDEGKGRQVGVYDPDISDNGGIVLAFPGRSIYAASDVIPVVPVDAPEEIAEIVPDPAPVPTPEEPEPPVYVPVYVAPDPPVITSSLTGSATEDVPWSYTITATGTGPLSYSVVSAPSWITGINALTGIISGTPPDVGTVNITIRATNAGGSDTETLVLTVLPAVANLSAVTVNNQVTAVKIVGNLCYVLGYFTSVGDSSSPTIARNRGACLNMATGLWTAWNPNIASVPMVLDVDGSHVYIGGNFTTVNGVSQSFIARVDPATGTRDATWTPVVNNTVTAIDVSGSTCLLGGYFTTVQGNTAIDYVAVLSKSAGAAASAGDPGSPNPISAPSLNGVYNTPSGLVMSGGSIGSSDAAYTWRSLGVNRSSGGSWVQMVSGASGVTCSGINDARTLVYAGGSLTNIIYPLQPATSDPRARGYCVVLSTMDATAWDPVVSATPNCIEVDDVYSGVFIGGGFASIGGDTARRVLGKVNATTGAVDATFLVTFSDVSMTVDALSTSSGVLAVGGNWTGNVNGVARSHLVILNSRTGALY